MDLPTIKEIVTIGIPNGWVSTALDLGTVSESIVVCIALTWVCVTLQFGSIVKPIIIGICRIGVCFVSVTSRRSVRPSSSVSASLGQFRVRPHAGHVVRHHRSLPMLVLL